MDTLTKREHALVRWIRHHPLFFVGGLALLLLAIRIYYFVLTYDQPVWWDEADYLNIARHWAFGQPDWDINPLRPLLFPFILAIFFKIGATEFIMRLIPFLSSLACIVLLYYVGRDLYNSSVGLIASFMLAVFWSFSFFSYRLLVDVPVTLLWLLSAFLFFRGYELKSKVALWLSLPTMVLAFLMKFTGGLLAPIFFIYMFITDRLKPLKNKHLWMSCGLALLASIPFFIFEVKKFGHIFAFYVTAIGGRPDAPRSFWQTLVDYVNTTLPLPHTAYFILFLIGFALLLFELVVGFDLLLKNKSQQLRSHLFILLLFLIPFFYIVSIGYGAYIEERYLFLMYPFMFIVAAKGLLFLFDHTREYSRFVAIAIVTAFLFFGAYQNLTHADQIIKDKLSSFIQVKEAGEWIEDRSTPDDIIFSHHTQAEMQYASNRNVMGFPGQTPEEFIDELRRIQPRFVVVNIFVPVEESKVWMITYPFEHPDIFHYEKHYTPYLDEQQTLPILTIFSVNPDFYT